MRKLLIPLAVAASLGAFAVTATGADLHAAKAKTKFVKVGDDFYSPTKVTVKPGDSVKWGWGNGTDDVHTVTESHGNWTSKRMTVGSFKHKFGKAGTFTIYCAEHPDDMRMRVVVTK